MAPATRFVAPDEHRRRTRRGTARGCGADAAELFDGLGAIVDEVAGAHVDDQRVASGLLGASPSSRDLADERRRQVVDDEEAEILEDVGGLGTAGTGHAGDDGDVER